jgi:hypothetical protein
MLSKFVMHQCIHVEMILTQFLDVNQGGGSSLGLQWRT